MIRSVTAGVVIVLLSTAPACARTLLHLAQSATVMVPPDELDASLRAEASSANAAEAQSRVNTMVTEALAQARKVVGVAVSTSGYTVWRVGPTPQDHSEHWQAGQTLELKSHDGKALLQLAGALQQKGLAMQQLEWRLSHQAEQKAHAEATKQAISELRGRIDEAAGLLGLRFESFRNVQLGVPKTPVFPRMMAAAMPAAAPPPSAVAQDLAVTATVEADAILVPR